MLIKDLPFKKQFKELMITGSKTMTSRNKQYGNPEDTFIAFDTIFTIVKVSRELLDIVANSYYKQEGFESPEEFKEIWAKIHPIKGWDPEQIVWVHEFKKCAEQKKLEV
jgi:hypothetical protein